MSVLRINWRRVLFWTAIALAGYWIYTDATGAGGNVHSLIVTGLGLLKHSATSVVVFLKGLFS